MSPIFKEVIVKLLQGSGLSLELFFLTLLGALPLGVLVYFAGAGRFAPLKYLMRGIVWVIRGTPLMLQLIVIYYGPGLLGKANFWGQGANGRMTAAAVAFIINYACYFSEIYRGGIESLPKGQQEAGRVLGLSRTQIFFHIELKQVYKHILPAMGNEVITLVKDTCLARIISVYELTFEGQSFIKSKGLIWPLMMTGVFYLVFSGVLTLIIKAEEKRLGYFR